MGVGSRRLAPQSVGARPPNHHRGSPRLRVAAAASLTVGAVLPTEGVQFSLPRIFRRDNIEALTPRESSHQLIGMKCSPCRWLLSKLVLLPVSIIMLFLAAANAEQVSWNNLNPATLPGCLDKCGNISIPFPFGIKPGCFLDGFRVTCENSFEPPRLFLEFNDTGKFNNHLEVNLSCDGATGSCDYVGNGQYLPVELKDISLIQAEARAYGMVRSNCDKGTTNMSRRSQVTNLKEPFILAPMRNVLVGVGRSILVDMGSSVSTSSGTKLRCLSDTIFDPGMARDGLCSGTGCCQIVVTPALQLSQLSIFGVGFKEQEGGRWPNFPCSYGMVVETSWYNFSTEDMAGNDVLPKKFPRGVPFVLDFAIRNGSCPAAGEPVLSDYACRSGNSSCAKANNGPGYICKCLEYYHGNPYIPNGCLDIDECALRDQYPELRKVYPCASGGICKNRIGGYDCPCKRGMKGDGKTGTCTEQFPLPAKVAVGVIGALFVVAVVVFLMLVRREKRRMKEYFDKNGGPILKDVNNIKIFKKDELQPILKSFNIIGKGGFGEVYKGLLSDQQVAVKKPINVDVAQKEQFANEIIIQSRVIHKNIVKLIGCCLEVDVPMLVYEFISKGSLDDILHGNNKKLLSLGQRLSIAAEAAEGLAYMHSKANVTIMHGDVKPANILLDDEYAPKISDFGISRLIAIDKAQHTNYVIGDRSYMDPIYLQTGLLTKKSDVYSFGVVLLELISRKKATYTDNNKLVTSFVDAQKTKSITTELFDKEITTATKDIEVLECLTGMAVECLQLDVDQRPEMTDVAERLLMLKRSYAN